MVKRSPYGNSIKDFEVIEKIGKGAFGEVFKAKSLQQGVNDEFVAIKRISKKKADRKILEKVKNEMEIHKSLPYNVGFVKCYTTFEDSEYWYLVLELCENGSFQEYIKSKRRLSEKEAAKLIEQVIHGVRFLHECCIIHRDLSLKNVLLKNGYKDVKIADFGLATKLPPEGKGVALTALGTPNFMSPQAMESVPYAYKTDCWSVGCILYNLLYGKPPFNGKTVEDIKNNVLNYEPEFPNYASNEAKALLMDMLNKDQEKRISIKDTLTYAFFQKYGKPTKRSESSYQKNGDSGLSSLSSSSTKPRCIQEIYGTYNIDSNYSGSQREKRNKSIKISLAHGNHHDNVYDANRYKDWIISKVQTPYHSSSKLIHCQNPGFANQMKTKVQTLPSRLESQFDVCAKDCPPSPSYPTVLKSIIADRNLSSPIYYSDHDSTESITRCKTKLKKCSSTHEQSCHVTSSFQGNVQMNSLCSHDQQYCKSNGSYQHISSNSNHSVENCMKDNKHYLKTSNSATEKCLRDILAPLNTARISSRRKELEKSDAVFSILNDGEVCIEYWKLKKSKKYVSLAYFISHDGYQITVYKPKKKILLDSDKPSVLSNNEQEVQFFTFENLPNTHWKKYQHAKCLVDTVRGYTPKVTIYGEKAKCIMMENSPNPNFEMNFYNGFQITEKLQKKIIKDKNGCIVKHDSSVDFMLKEFEHMKERCIMLEKNIETYHDSNFPVTLGKNSDANRRNGIQDISKENVTPSHRPLSSANVTGGKSYDVTINLESSPYQNSFQRSISTPQLSKKNGTTSENISSSSPQLKNTMVREEWVIAVYSDDIKMCISMQDNRVLFYDAHTKESLSSRQYPQLMNRFHNDSRQILCKALSKEVKNRT